MFRLGKPLHIRGRYILSVKMEFLAPKPPKPSTRSPIPPPPPPPSTYSFSAPPPPPKITYSFVAPPPSPKTKFSLSGFVDGTAKFGSAMTGLEYCVSLAGFGYALYLYGYNDAKKMLEEKFDPMARTYREHDVLETLYEMRVWTGTKMEEMSATQQENKKLREENEALRKENDASKKKTGGNILLLHWLFGRG